jgi:RNA polymerase sigma-70 factor (ECF subfamily)
MMAETRQKTKSRSEVFERLVLDHMDMLYAVALRLTRDPTEAQDLTQNTVVKALRFHTKFKEGSYIKAWLLTIMRNTFINEYRRKARRPYLVELTGSEAAADTSPDAEMPYVPMAGESGGLLELLDDEVRKAVESLPEDFRTAVVMADLEDRSYKEIADILDCPLGTVMSRLHRGRKLLRKQLADYAKEHRIIGNSSS